MPAVRGPAYPKGPLLPSDPPVQPPPMRPRVSVLVGDHPDAAIAAVQSWADYSPRCRVVSASSRHIVLSVSADEATTWSPYLDIDFEPQPDGTRIRGRFGPSPHVWTFFLAVYAAQTFFCIGSAMLGMSQMTMGADTWALWGLPLGGALIALTYAGALLGQRLGGEQMRELQLTLDDALDDLQPTQGMVG
jgi:hypothetical protein